MTIGKANSNNTQSTAGLTINPGGSSAVIDNVNATSNNIALTLNAITRVLAAELRGEGILVNSVSPGWVASDMGGASAPRTLEQGAESVLWAVRIPDDGPTGGFFEDAGVVPW